MGQVAHALLTRPPLSRLSWFPSQQAGLFTGRGASFDLHVLSTPPAFILSQDQTLMFKVRSLRIKACRNSLLTVPFPFYPRIILVSRLRDFLILLELNRVWFLTIPFHEFFKVVPLFSYQGTLLRECLVPAVCRTAVETVSGNLWCVSEYYLTKEISSCQHLFSIFCIFLILILV